MVFFKNDDKPQSSRKTQQVPLLPLRDIIVFPYMVVPLFVGREKSVRALEEAMNTGKRIVLSAQRDAKTNDPQPSDIYEIGTLGTIIQLLRLPDGTVKVLVEGKRRVRISSFVSEEELFLVDVEDLSEGIEFTEEIEALVRTIKTAFEAYVKLNKQIPPEMLATVNSIDDPSRLADTIIAHLKLKLTDKQDLLETENPEERLERLYELMQAEIEILQVEKKIRTRVKRQMEKTQKEYYLNEQMQAIQKELGERDEFKNEVEELEERIRNKDLPDEAQARIQKELRKFKMMSPMSAEASVVRNYIDWILSLPWFDTTEEKLDLKEAEDILESDHYGLEKPKERILEYLAVHSLVDRLRGPILCMVGPPGVGKTSLARSMARATGRKFVRLSLGGVRDEAEIRGHRRTYIGALPGKIIQSLKKCGSNNPVFLLDEIDKMSMDFRGDPSSALLEVLDPEQNTTFGDHYLDLDYDLSQVMFVTTANSLQDIPIPLRDRMEIIQISGYTEYEKMNIARRYLISKQQKANGIEDIDLHFNDSAVRSIINHYTYEAGVRSLEREIGAVCRKVAVDVVKNGDDGRSFKISHRRLPKMLGPHKYNIKRGEDKDEIGLVNGLAVTMFGGTLLVNEVTIMPGKGKLVLTGQLRDIMQESAQAAMSYIRSRATNLGIARDFSHKIDIHVHFPGDHIPKDGPSAGITMATSIISALTQIPVRREVAMTGEISLRGRVLPIGGLKEKVLAAHRAGLKTVIFPKENRKDLRDIPKPVRKAMNFVIVEHLDEVLAHALVIDDPKAFAQRLAQPMMITDVRAEVSKDSLNPPILEPVVQEHVSPS